MGWTEDKTWNETTSTASALTDKSGENQVQKKQHKTRDSNPPTRSSGLRILAFLEPAEKKVVHDREESTCDYCPDPQRSILWRDKNGDEQSNTHANIYGCVFFPSFHRLFQRSAAKQAG